MMNGRMSCRVMRYSLIVSDLVLLLLVRQHKIEEALDAGDKLLVIYRRLNLSWIHRGHTEHTLSHIVFPT